MFRRIMSTMLLAVLVFSAAGCNISDNKDKNKYTATVESDSFYIASQVSGQITEVNVSQGDKITAGKVAAKLDSRSYELQKKEAEGSLKAAKSKLDELPQNASQSLKDAAQGTVDQAQAAVDLAQLQIDNTSIKAQNDGVITEVFLHKGEICSQGMNIAKEIDENNKFIKIYLEESKRKSVKDGDKLKLYDGDKLIGKAVIVYISPESEFTPKNTETKSEKEKTLFQIKAKLEDNVNANIGMLIDAEVD